MKISRLLQGVSILGMVLAFTSCTPDDNYSPGPSNVAHGILVNASPDSGELFFYADANAVNAFGLDYNDVDAAGYYGFYAGDRQFSVKNSANQVIATDSVSLEIGDVFTTFAIKNNANYELVTFRDSLTAPEYGRSKVRFINLSPDTPQVVVTAGGENMALDFKEASAYKDLTVGAGVSFVFRLPDTEEPILNFSASAMSAGSIYTVYLRGYSVPPTGSQATISAKVIRNY